MQGLHTVSSYSEVFYLHLFQVGGNVPNQGSNRFLQIRKLLLFPVELFIHCLQRKNLHQRGETKKRINREVTAQ